MTKITSSRSTQELRSLTKPCGHSQVYEPTVLTHRYWHLFSLVLKKIENSSSCITSAKLTGTRPRPYKVHFPWHSLEDRHTRTNHQYYGIRMARRTDFSRTHLHLRDLKTWSKFKSLTDALGTGIINSVAFIADASIARHIVDTLAILMLELLLTTDRK